MKRFARYISDWLQADPRSPRLTVYHLMSAILHPQFMRERFNERRFYKRLLGKMRGLIFDIGASRGNKAEIFYRYGPVVCVEPSPDAAASLRKRFANCPELVTIEGAIANAPGSGTLLEFEPGSAFNTLKQECAEALSQSHTNRFGLSMPVTAKIEVRLLTVDELIAQYGRPRYVKLDVEGFEWPAIQGMSQSCELVSAEFSLPETWPDLERVVERLEALGSNVRFNAVISEPPVRFEFPEWLSGAEILPEIRRREWCYMELYCKSTVS